jgi:nucleoside-triphosphatase
MADPIRVTSSNSARTRILSALGYFIENLEVILSIVLAIIAAAVSMFGSNQQLAIAATAGVLTVLSIGVLRDRHSREKTTRTLESMGLQLSTLASRPAADLFFSRKTGEQSVIRAAEDELLLVQETGRLIAETCRQDIVNLLRKGGKVRWICVLDTEEMAQLLAFRNANLRSTTWMNERMQSGTQMIEVLAKEAQTSAERLEVRFLPYPTGITAVMRDPLHVDKRKREALIRLQGFRVTFDDKVDFLLDAVGSREVFELYHSQLQEMWKASTKCLFLTGRPGVGKSTLLEKVVRSLPPDLQRRTRGFITKDLRDEQGRRVGFQTTTLVSGKDGKLASKNSDGSYILHEPTMTEIILPALAEDLADTELMVIDEIGPIQLQNKEFQHAIERLLSNRSLNIIGILAVEGHPYLSKIRQHYRTGIVEVTEANRDQLIGTVLSEFSQELV